MKTSQIHLNPRTIRAGLAAFAVALLVAGGVWRGVVAEGQAAVQSRTAAPVTAPLRDISASRTSYADVVNAGRRKW